MTDQENLEMDDILERITFYCLDEAQTKLEAGDELTRSRSSSMATSVQRRTFRVTTW